MCPKGLQYGGKVTTRPALNHEIARIATPQHGVITRRQLLELGLGAKAIDYRVRSGRLHRLHRGVFAVGHRPPSPLARAMAAVLVCGPGAALSHFAAGVLWGILARWRAALDVTARGKHSHAGVRVHRSRTLTQDEVTDHFGIRVTTPARTVFDLADALGDRALARAVNDARVKRLLTLGELERLMARFPCTRASKRLRPLCEHAGGPTRSVFEDEFLRFAERHGLPRPEVNAEVAGHEVDMLWRDQGLIVEFDSREFHDDDQAFETDRERDAELLAAGLHVVRVTWRRLTDSAGREAQRLEHLLS